MKAVLLAAALTTLLFSCQKTTEEPQDFSGKYKITQLVFQSKGNPDQDLLSTFPDCAQDNLLVFGANSSFTTEDAGVSCGEEATEPTAWSAKGNKMTIDGVQSNIVSFDSHTLVLSTPMEFMDIPGTVLETLEKQ